MTTFRERFASLFTTQWLPGIWPALIRMFLGVLLVYHGTSKVFEGKIGSMANMLDKRGWFMPELQAIGASYVEFAGGILLIVGLFTRPTAIAVVGLFAVVVFVFHGADPFSTQEKGVLFLAMALYVMFNGPGKFSVDHFLFTKNVAPAPAERRVPPASE